MAWELFATFFIIGLVSFGGGYAMIPLIQEEAVLRHDWLTAQQFTDVVAIAGMSPGPIATNTAIVIGYRQMGVGGALASAAGIILPSLLIIIVLSTVLHRIRKYRSVESAFYGLRAVVTGLIVYAAIVFAINNRLFAGFDWQTVSLLLIYFCSLAAFVKLRIHPVFVLAASGAAGVLLFS